MEATPKPKRAPRSKKAAAAAAAGTADSIVSAFGGKVPTPVQATATEVEPPALFVEEVSTPTPMPAAKKKPSGKKPNIVATVTPDGIQGTLTPLTEQRPLIAHLPIHMSDIDNELFASSVNSDPATTTGVTGPKPYDPDDVFASFGSAIVTMPTESVASAPVAPVAETSAARPSLPLHYSEKLMIRFQDANREKHLPDSTDVACFWDCHAFRGHPCVIPVSIEEGIWRVYGNFCSPECAAAYLFNERLDSSVQWERYALLNRLYANGEQSVRLAPPRTILRLFGGMLDISEFRAIVAERRMRVDVMTPPMISIIQVMDTKPIDFYDASMKNTFIPWEMDRMNRPGAQGLRLRRTKPVAEKEATLEWCMGIKA
jgi:hypothetical protein